MHYTLAAPWVPPDAALHCLVPRLHHACCMRPRMLLQVEGTIPQELVGTYLRNGPGMQVRCCGGQQRAFCSCEQQWTCSCTSRD